MATTTATTRKTAAAAPAKTTAPAKKSAPAKVEDDETPATANELRALARDIAGMIKSGSLDAYLSVIDAAIESRMKSAESEKPTAPRAPAKSVAEKTAPVTRKKPAESASAPKSESAKVAEKLAPAVPTLKVGGAYVVNGGTKFHGAKVRVMEIITDGPTIKAKVEFREEYIGPDGRSHKSGKVATFAAKMLVTAMVWGKIQKNA